MPNRFPLIDQGPRNPILQEYEAARRARLSDYTDKYGQVINLKRGVKGASTSSGPGGNITVTGGGGGSGGGSGITSINGLTSPAQSLADVDDTNVTLNWTSSGSTHTLTAGWAGALGPTRGGTGIATYTQGDILYSDAANSLAKLAKNTNATRYLSNTGTSNNPAWAQVNLANGVTGDLPVTNLNGGSGASSSTFWRGDGTWASAGGGGSTTFDVAGDGGTPFTIADTDTLEILGEPGTGITTQTIAAFQQIFIGLDLGDAIDALTPEDDIDPEDDYVPFWDDSAAEGRKINPTELLWEFPLRRMPYVYEEFHNVPTTALTTYWNSAGYLTVNGASAAIIGVTATAAHPGVAAIRTGTATTGRAALMGSATGVLLGGGEWHFMEINLIAVASDATDRYTVRLGFGDNDAGEPTDGVYFRYVDNVNSGRWQCVTRAGGVETGSATDSGVALDTANYVKFEIIINAGATSVDFLINGSVVATNTANIPSAATGTLPGSIIKSAGSNSRQVQIDCVGYHHSLTTRR